MCYRISERQSAATEPGGAPLPPSFRGLRPRWIGAVAATLIGGFALAALVAPASTSSLTARRAQAPAALASTAVTIPTAPIADQVSASQEDGLPDASDVAKAGLGDCQKDL